MGLDMYLYAETGDECREVAYWRKANQVHGWFVEHVNGGEDQSTKHYSVTREQLRELLQTAKDALAHYRAGRPEGAEDLLPPTSGFFFGSTTVDEGYADDLEMTVKTLEDLLAEPELAEARWQYMAWW